MFVDVRIMDSNVWPPVFPGHLIMSKRSLFWGNASGKLGEAVYYRAGGEQRTRTWVPKIKNPKTIAQMSNRISMLNLVSMYRSYKSILSVSFPKRPTNQSGFNAFVQANKSARPYGIFKEDCDSGFFYPFNYKVAQGDLPLSTVGNVALVGLPNDDDAPKSARIVFGGLLPGTVHFEFSATDDPMLLNISPRTLYQLMTANGNPNNLPANFKVTVMGGHLDVGYAEDSHANGCFSAAYIQYLCSATASTEPGPDIRVGNPINTESLELTWGITTNYVSDPDTSETGTADVESVATNNNDATVDGYDLCAAVVVSYTMDGKLRTTTSSMINGPFFDSEIISVSPGGDIWNQVLEAYGYNSADLLSTR